MEYLESSKRGKEAKLREEWEETRGLRVGDRKRGKKKRLVSCYLQIPKHYRIFPWASREGRTGTWPYQNQNSSSWQEELEALRPDSYCGTGKNRIV